MSRDATRRRNAGWFDLGVRALGTISADIDDAYACPCCLHAFGRDALNDGTLTAEDVPPKSLGGRPLLLTCAPCNSRAGSALDAHAERADAHLDFVQGTSSRPLRGTITTAGVPLIGEAASAADGITFVGVPKANRPGQPGKVIDVLDAAETPHASPTTITFTSHELWSPQASDISWLRAAYLAAFAVLGYRYIANADLDPVRAAFDEPHTFPSPIPVRTEPHEPRTRRELFVVTEPAWLHAIVVRIGRHTVFLPARFPDPDFFDRITGDLRSGRDGLAGTWEIVQFGWPRSPEFRMDLGRRHAQRDPDPTGALGSDLV
jgi:hypothetical protein